MRLHASISLKAARHHGLLGTALTRLLAGCWRRILATGAWTSTPGWRWGVRGADPPHCSIYGSGVSTGCAPVESL